MTNEWDRLKKKYPNQFNKSTFNRWTELSNPNDKRRVSIKKWLNECESVLYDDAINTATANENELWFSPQLFLKPRFALNNK